MSWLFSVVMGVGLGDGVVLEITESNVIIAAIVSLCDVAVAAEVGAV